MYKVQHILDCFVRNVIMILIFVCFIRFKKFRWHLDPICKGQYPKNYENIEKTLRDIRRTKVRKSPTTAEEVELAFQNQNVMDSLGTSLYGQRGLLFNTIQIHENFSNCIFSSPSSIALVKRNFDIQERFFVMDGTFAITPRGIFNQVLVVNVRFELKVMSFTSSSLLLHFFKIL